MAVTVVENTTRQKWLLTQEAFDGFLNALGPDRGAAGERYLEIRGNLVRLFEWRGCSSPDELADETINRCAKKIGDGEEIRDVATYCIGIARMLVREASRRPDGNTRALDDVPEPRSVDPEPAGDAERKEECLRGCLSHLSAENRDLILRYYQGHKGDKIANRKGLMKIFDVPPSTLRMRALRLREKLQSCMQDCLERECSDGFADSGRG